MTVPVGRLAPADQWDQNMLDQLFANELWPTGLDFDRIDGYPRTAGTILIIPGRYWAQRTSEINASIARYEWVLAIRTGDEEDTLDITKIQHPNLRWWVQTPRADRDYGDARLFGVGFPPSFNTLPDAVKNIPVFLSAQCTHARRTAAFDALTSSGLDTLGHVEATEGFTKGMPPDAYARCMAAAIIAPAPSGAFSPDSFRVWEALEAHAIPIADDISPAYDSAGYWRKVLPDAPFPIITNYSDLPGWIADQLADYPRNTNRITAWWIAHKRRTAGRLAEDLTALGAPACPHRSPITVLVSSSPIPSHPSTAILEETIISVRTHLPDAEIILTFDGVGPEHEARRADYESYIQRALWLADHHWHNVLPLIEDTRRHQAVCTKHALAQVDTPLVLFVEHDTPLYIDRDIPWYDLAATILGGTANLVRLHHEASILEPHRHLMLSDAPQEIWGVPMMRTIQWSQRPHLASTAFYRNLLDRWFPADEPNYIEEVMHSQLINAYQRDGDMGWLGWRTWMYTPDGTIQRSYHLDGRAGENNG